MIPPVLRRAAAPALAGLVCCGLLLTGLSPATASPLGDAKARAEALRKQVDGLRLQAEIETERYDEAYAALGAAVTAHLTAQRDLETARTAADVTDEVRARRVRALYMSGGTSALYAKVLESASITDVAQRVREVQVVLDGDRRASSAAEGGVLARAAAEQRLEATAARSTRLQKAVADRADKVRELLARTDALLASADQQVRDLAEQQRQAQEAAAAARAAAALARARTTGGTLPDVPASPVAAAALAFAQQQLGKPYVWGATGPDSYDCSGLTGAAYAAAGLALPRTSREQWYAGPHVDLADLQPGDLLFWSYDSDPATIHHVALYAGNGLMVAAPHTGDVVRVQPVYLDGYLGAVRPGAVAVAAP